MFIFYVFRIPNENLIVNKMYAIHYAFFTNDISGDVI
jgi:hypothetical protein